MKIMYFTAHPNAIGGALMILLIQAGMMVKLGHDVKVVVQNDEHGMHIPEYERLGKKFGLDLLYSQYSIATCMEEIDILRSINDYDKIKKLISDFSPDIVHSLQLNTTVELVARDINMKHVMTVFQLSKGMFELDWLDAYPKYHLCDSLYYSNQWKTGLDICSQCIRTYYEKKNSDNKKVIQRESTIQIINVAVSASHKGQLELLKFVKLCVENGIDIHVTFLGDNNNEYGLKCKQYASDHGLVDKVSFVGVTLEVEEYYRNADVMIHPSSAESYPVVIVEAMANKVPVLVAPVAGITELVMNEYNGFLTEGYTAEDIFESFNNFVSYRERNKLTPIIENAYQTYLENHTEQKVQNQLQMYYNMIISDENGKNDYGVENLSELFHSFMPGKNNFSAFTMKHVWLLYHIFEKLKTRTNREIYIWGAGVNGKVALEWCEILEHNVKGYIDTYKEGEYLGYNIMRPTEVEYDKDCLILVSIANFDVCRTIIEYLNSKGMKRNINYFLMHNDPCY